MRYLKKFYFIVISVILLSSCGLVGGGDEVEVRENSVLSGPPLANPPEFDIDGQNAQQQSSPNYDLQNSNELEETENFENIPTYQENENEDVYFENVPNVANIDNDVQSNDVQSFENYNPNLNQVSKQTQVNNNVRVQRVNRSSVPSDAYNFGKVITNKRKTYAQKKESFSGFGVQNFEQTQGIGNNNNLSKEEEFLLEDLINQQNTISEPDEFDTRGDSE